MRYREIAINEIKTTIEPPDPLAGPPTTMSLRAQRSSLLGPGDCRVGLMPSSQRHMALSLLLAVHRIWQSGGASGMDKAY
jgi:hypothetical protein